MFGEAVPDRHTYEFAFDDRSATPCSIEVLPEPTEDEEAEIEALTPWPMPELAFVNDLPQTFKGTMFVDMRLFVTKIVRDVKIKQEPRIEVDAIDMHGGTVMFSAWNQHCFGDLEVWQCYLITKLQVTCTRIVTERGVRCEKSIKRQFNAYTTSSVNVATGDLASLFFPDPRPLPSALFPPPNFGRRRV